MQITRFSMLKVSVLGLVSLLCCACGTRKSLKDLPNISNYEVVIPKRVKISDSVFRYNNNFLSKNKQGLWELYLEGNAYERGLISGALTQELYQYQEAAFFSKVKEIVPSKTKLKLLRKFLEWYNRKLYLHVPEDYKTEIYGLSQYASKDFNDIAPSYLRALYLHGAHDIGHAVQDLALVGCTSFAAWGNKTSDGHLLIGRNFDFYAGDDFAKNKIVAFVKPDKGYNYMSVSWAGMIGVVSGMNEQGLTVTINAGKSKIPMIAKTPISIVTRDILQYASNIDEAIAIAKKHEIFVSESILVGSAKDKRAVTIEVSPDNFGVYETKNTNQLICSNHFQSEAYANDQRNIDHKAESHSVYRYERLEELMGTSEQLNPKIAASILRNKEGLNDKNIGYGNEKALNQLLAHHSIIFKPEDGLVWVASSPYQLGTYVAYNLNEVFNDPKKRADLSLETESLNIPEDYFKNTQAFLDYEEFRSLRQEVIEAIDNDLHASPKTLSDLIQLNGEFWEAYYLVGKYYYNKGYYKAALNAFERAKTKEITTVPDEDEINSYIKKLKQKLD